ncbi:hypothetical protein SAMN05878391_1363 [Salinicoccus kekensis]|uniref:DUF1850 domain-containing protein n=2 Tax=Salinicoccus kekensis TaxID=714307 RepID=A0A285UIF5_9STAP|nr:hypothetical protein SAMN05878391_1363 [Salinicoccus kekensis]
MFIREHSASTMSNKKLWVASGSIITVLLLFFLWPRSALVIEAEGHTPVCLKPETFELHWIHSIEHEEWYEVYEVKGDDLLLTRTYFKTFGAGVPTDSETPPEITDEGFVEFTVNVTYPELNVNVSENVETRIVQDDHDHLLYEMYEPNTSVNISVGNKSVLCNSQGGLI